MTDLLGTSQKTYLHALDDEFLAQIKDEAHDIECALAAIALLRERAKTATERFSLDRLKQDYIRRSETLSRVAKLK